MERSWSAVPVLMALVMSPFLFSVINRTKAFFGGRRGQPLLQPYADIAKLLRKGAVYSRTTTRVFRIGPVAGLASVLAALALTPLGPSGALVSFEGDVVLFVYLFAVMRFVTVLAALDTGSAFEGMGASREVQFSALGEVAFFLGITALAALTHRTSLSGILDALGNSPEVHGGRPVHFLVGSSLFVVLLAENARLPVDDPETHLELTMIHEVMVLDHGGVDLGLIQYAGCLKLWVMASLLAGVVLPAGSVHTVASAAILPAGILALAVLIGVVESTMARLRLVMVPQLLVAAGVLALLALIVVPG
ncbi:NADH-quinone oxidoreductase subunit H [bacterium]|nr:NADH-quinone oxidoreductase subunit H [bacterium]